MRTSLDPAFGPFSQYRITWNRNDSATTTKLSVGVDAPTMRKGHGCGCYKRSLEDTARASLRHNGQGTDAGTIQGVGVTSLAPLQYNLISISEHTFQKH